VNALGNQISVQYGFQTSTRSVLIVEANSGKALKNFELNNVSDDALTNILLTKDNEIWLHFNNDTYKIEEERGYDYWIGYDESSKKALWRTDGKNRGLGSLIKIAPRQISIKPHRFLVKSLRIPISPNLSF
jgi:hypothetical protein